MLFLVKASPNWSTKYKTYEICTAGINPVDYTWRRLYPFSEELIVQEGIRIWDIIEIKTTKPTDDPRFESRKIDPKSIKIVGRINDRQEKRDILSKLAEGSLENALNNKRSLALIEPSIIDFKIDHGEREPIQLAMDGTPFRKNPYGDLRLVYKWQCLKRCRYCSGKQHTSRCFDWGANWLFRKLLRSNDEEQAIFKTKKKMFFDMKYTNDTWFAMGTTRLRPWKRWMVVGIIWMKKQESLKPPEPDEPESEQRKPATPGQATLGFWT